MHHYFTLWDSLRSCSQGCPCLCKVVPNQLELETSTTTNSFSHHLLTLNVACSHNSCIIKNKHGIGWSKNKTLGNFYLVDLLLPIIFQGDQTMASLSNDKSPSTYELSPSFDLVYCFLHLSQVFQRLYGLFVFWVNAQSNGSKMVKIIVHMSPKQDYSKWFKWTWLLCLRLLLL